RLGGGIVAEDARWFGSGCRRGRRCGLRRRDRRRRRRAGSQHDEQPGEQRGADGHEHECPHAISQAVVRTLLRDWADLTIRTEEAGGWGASTIRAPPSTGKFAT